VGAEPSPELAALAKENPTAYTAAIRKANSLMNFDFGDVLDLGNAENQRKFLTNDPPPPFDKTAKEEQKLWRNYMLDYSTKVERWERPNTLDRLVNAVRDAGAAKKPIRAVGAGHSSADVARPPPSGLVELDKLERITLPPFLKQGVDASRLRRMEAGISIRHVNDLLRRETQDYPHGLALENMGSYDEQSIIGAACTGTHGSGIGLPALNGSLASVVLVTLREQGGKMVPRILQIEPTNGITDPATFDPRTGGLDADLYTPSADLSWELIQDDRYFNAISVSLGCFGVVYAVTLRLRPSFWLEESRVVMPWRKVKQSFLDDMKKVRCYELLISPYPTFQEDGSLDYTTLVTRRKEIPWQDEVPKTRKMGLASFADRLIADLNISDMATELISDVLMNDPKVETHLP
ncbi:MAG TPA: FAD-binding protein, partial [Myxococcota bacterium]|nr:FAD-binding protein [Myxococcota bacterium]